MIILDSRPYAEFHNLQPARRHRLPGAELVHRVFDLVQRPDTTIVVNCAGANTRHHRCAVADQCRDQESSRLRA